MANYILGSVVGLVVGLILVLILHFTAFKSNPKIWLYVLILIFLAVCGGVIQYTYFKISSSKVPAPEEQIKNITTTVEDNWKNTNGGFTFEQIQKSQDDDDCPTYDDQIVSLTCHDFDNYIVFSFKNADEYENTLFYKSKNGLILDGMINTTATYDFYGGIFNFNLDSFKWKFEKNKEPYYFEKTGFFTCDYDNIVSCSRQTAYFVENLEGGLFTFNRKEATSHALKEASYMTGLNATSHFVRFGDIELIGSASTGYRNINTFYNYLYEQIKGNSYNTSKVIDATNSLCVPIPVELQKNYPVSVDKKAEYNDAEYYGVYRCNIAVDLMFKDGNETAKTSSKNADYVNKIEKEKDLIDKIIVDVISPRYQYSKLSLNFKDTQNSDLTNVNLFTDPVKITFSCEELKTNKVVYINSKLKLNSTVNVLLNKNANWTYLIESKNLIFENFRGSFSMTDEKGALNFDYYYLDNFVLASVGLNPVGTIDKSVIDLVANPVRIILSNDKQTYQFVFDNNSVLDTYKNMIVEMGTYSYTILSQQLVFASVSGNLTITTTDKIMLFNYGLKVDQPLTFDVQIKNTSYNDGNIRLHSDSSYVAMIRDTLPSNKTYIVSCYIYDNDGKLVQSFNHTHASASTGVCSDIWTPTLLTSGTAYTAQLRFSASEDSSITYLSDVCTFTYDSTISYELSYTTAKN